VGALLALGRAARVARRGAVDDRGRPAEPDETSGEERDGGDDRATALVPAYCALPLAAAAGWAALPGPPGWAPLLLAAVACGFAAALGQIGVRAPAPVLIATVVVAAAVATAVVVGQRFGVAVPALSAAGAALALSAGPLLPRLVLRSAGLPRPVVPTEASELTAADGGPDLLPPAELAGRARSARAQLTGLTGGFAVLAAAAAPAAATAHAWAGPALAAVAVVVLLLRTRGMVDAGAVRVHLAAGLTAGVVLVGLLASASGTVGRLCCAVALLGAAAVGVAALGTAAGPRVTTAAAPPGAARPASPVVRRALDVTEGVLTALAVPLALAAAGVFAVVRAL
jgi:type VII secretion integral membrane protein EccD